jgi:RNA polymerase sigma-70 factor (ECF subfamily)
MRVRDPRDRDAWEQFVGVYQPMVQRYCRRQGLQDADATDVAQEVMAGVSRSIRRLNYQPARGSFRNWLFVVTRNQLRKFFRRQKPADRGAGRTSVQQALAAHPDEQETADWDEDCRRRLFEWAASRARDEFTAATWRAFVMTAVEGKAARDVGEELGITPGAVYTARSRVLARLKELIAQDLGERAPE